MFILEILKAFCLGVCAAVPIGPVCVFVLQKTLCKGRKTGLVTGLGSTVIDTVYAWFGIFAIGLIMDMIDRYQDIILMIGGVVVVVVGWRMFITKHDFNLGCNTETRSRTAAGYALQCAACALANPGAIAMILALVAILGIHVENLTLPFWAVLPFVAAGEFSYWMLFTWAAGKLGNKLSSSILTKISRISGLVIIVLGAVLAIRGVILI